MEAAWQMEDDDSDQSAPPDDEVDAEQDLERMKALFAGSQGTVKDETRMASVGDDEDVQDRPHKRPSESASITSNGLAPAGKRVRVTPLGPAPTASASSSAAKLKGTPRADSHASDTVSSNGKLVLPSSSKESMMTAAAVAKKKAEDEAVSAVYRAEAERKLNELIGLCEQIKTQHDAIKKKRLRRTQLNRLREKEFDSTIREITAAKARRDRREQELIAKAERAERAERLREQRAEARVAKEQAKLEERVKREERRVAERDERRRLAALAKEESANRRKAELEARRAERERAKEEERERRLQEKKEEQLRREEEALAEIQARLALVEDTTLPVAAPESRPLAPKSWSWLDSSLGTVRRRWGEEQSNQLAASTGDVLSVLEFVSHFGEYVIGPVSSAPLTCDVATLQSVLFGVNYADLQAAHKLHQPILEMLLEEDNERKMYYTDWLYGGAVFPSNAVNFSTVLRLFLETYVTFCEEHAGVLDQLAVGDYTELLPSDRLAILLYLRDTLLSNTTLREQFEDSDQAVKQYRAQLRSLQAHAKPTKAESTESLCRTLVKAIKETREDYEDGTFRELWTPTFAEIPSAEVLPDYLDIIAQPISFNEITEKIDAKEYNSVDNCMSDIRLMFDNARQYNPATSWVVIDANAMQEVAENKAKLLRIKEQALGAQKASRADADNVMPTTEGPPSVVVKEIATIQMQMAAASRKIRSGLLGRDRYLNMYYVLDTFPGLHVQRHPGFTNTDGAGPAQDEKESEDAETDALFKAHMDVNMASSAPWSRYIHEREFDRLVASLDVNGEREKFLFDELEAKQTEIMMSMKAAREQSAGLEAWKPDNGTLATKRIREKLRDSLLKMQTSWLADGLLLENPPHFPLTCGGDGNIPETHAAWTVTPATYDAWRSKLEEGKTITDVALAFRVLFACLTPRALKTQRWDKNKMDNVDYRQELMIILEGVTSGSMLSVYIHGVQQSIKDKIKAAKKRT